MTRGENNTMTRKLVNRPTYQCQYSDCNYVFKTRRDSPAARCPACGRLNWLHGDRTERALQLAAPLTAPPPSAEEPKPIEEKSEA